MKILSIPAFFAVALLGFASCNKQYDTEVSDSQTNNNNNNNGGNGSGLNFTWSGTAPLSAKVDGVPFLATNVMFTESLGYYSISAQADDGSSITPSIPVGAIPGLIYSFPNPANIGWQSTPSSGSITLGARSGKVKIVTNNSTTLEGYFWADTKDYTAQIDTVVYLREGYFKFDKP